MRTEVYSGQRRADGQHHLPKPFVNLLQSAEGEKTPRYPGLIRDDHQSETHVHHSAQPRGGAGLELQCIGVRKIISIHHDGAVTIQHDDLVRIRARLRRLRDHSGRDVPARRTMFVVL